MMTLLQNIKRRFGDSPLIGISIIACLFSVIRLILYRLRIPLTRPAPFDFPFFSDYSPVATEINMTLTLSLITLIGMGAALGGLLRKKEKWRYFGVLTLALNLGAWWWMSRLLDWLWNPPPGVDY
jgi:hypothetical protein